MMDLVNGMEFPPPFPPPKGGHPLLTLKGVGLPPIASLEEGDGGLPQARRRKVLKAECSVVHEHFRFFR